MSHKELSWNQEGTKLFAQGWTVENPKSVLCIVHGFAEHGGRYARPAAFFNEQGISVFAIDQFGHGKTEGTRGYSPSYEATLDSVDKLIAEAKSLSGNAPVFLWGHSMGGNVVVNYLLRRKPAIRGAIASAPWLRLGFEPPKFKIMLAKFMKNIYPKFPEKANLDTSHLSRDKEEVKKYDNDPLVHNQATAGTFFETFDAGYWAIEHAEALSNDLFLFHGTEDKLISPHGSSDFAKNAPKNHLTFKLYDGFYHELHNEPEVDRTRVLNDMLQWINSKLA